MKIHHIAISVKDLEKSIEFYEDIFGLKELKRFTKEGRDMEAAILKLGSIELEIFQFKDFSKGKNDLSNLKITGLKHIGFEVDSVDRIYNKLKDKKINIDEPKKGTTCKKYCFLKDPDGISIELYEK